MPDIYFTSKAWEDIGWWVENDLKTLRKIYKLIDAASKSTFSGLGHS